MAEVCLYTAINDESLIRGTGGSEKHFFCKQAIVDAADSLKESQEQLGKIRHILVLP